MIKKMRLEMKQVGTAWFPFVMTIILLLFLYLTRNYGEIEQKINILTQALLPFIGMWLAVAILSEYISNEAQSFFFTFDFLRKGQGIGMFVRWFTVGICVVVFNILMLKTLLGVDLPIVLFVAQSMFLGSLAYCFLAWSRSFGWTLLLVIVIISSAILTQGQLYGRFSFFIPDLINTNPEIINEKSIFLFGVSFFLMVLGAMRIRQSR